MIINGKWMNEPEIKSLISQLTADKKRLERQMTVRKRELQSWGRYYSCECYKPKPKVDDFVQLSFFKE